MERISKSFEQIKYSHSGHKSLAFKKKLQHCISKSVEGHQTYWVVFKARETLGAAQKFNESIDGLDTVL